MDSYLAKEVGRFKKHCRQIGLVRQQAFTLKINQMQTNTQGSLDYPFWGDHKTPIKWCMNFGLII